MADNGHRFDPVILREYDIRGVVGETLGAADARALGRSLGSIVARQGGRFVAVGYDGRLTSPPNPVPPGAYVELEARADLICVVSSCPYDLKVNDWEINAPGGPTELVIELL